MKSESKNIMQACLEQAVVILKRGFQLFNPYFCNFIMSIFKDDKTLVKKDISSLT